MRHAFFAMAVAAALFASGCAAKVLTYSTIVDDRSTKYLMQQTGSMGGGEKNTRLYSYSVEVCDFNETGVETNCAESTLLQNVRYNKILYQNISR